MFLFSVSYCWYSTVHTNIKHGWKSIGWQKVVVACAYLYRVLLQLFLDYPWYSYERVSVFICTWLFQTTASQSVCDDIVTKSKFWLLHCTSYFWFVLTDFHTGSTSGHVCTTFIPQGVLAKWLIFTLVIFYATFWTKDAILRH